MTRARILVIDDDPLFRSLITSMLRRDFLVSVAAEGSEGYYKALEHPPHLAIIDVQMPGWDGLRTLQAIRAHHILAKVPVMMLTSDASRQTVLAAIQAGASDYVIKTTLSRDELLKKTHRLIAQDVLRSAIGGGDSNEAAQTEESAAAGAASPQHALSQATAQDPARVVEIGSEAATLQALMDNWE